jgi:hypothetical protein
VNILGHNSDSARKLQQMHYITISVVLVKPIGLRHVSTASCGPSLGSVHQNFL